MRKLPKWIRAPTGVHIMWEDHSITRDNDTPHEGALYQQSVGYIKKEGIDKHGNAYIVICQSYDEQEDFSDCLTILEKNIVRRKKA